MNRKTMVAAAALAAFVTQTTSAIAACGVTINGMPMSRQMCALAIQIYGRVVPGHYWMDEQGTWGRLGEPYPLGNLFLDAQGAGSGSASGGNGYIDRGPFGNMGSDGSCSYYNDPETGATVMSGNC